MPSHNKQSTTASADPGSIPEKIETWDERFELTESNLRSWLFGSYERQRQPIYEAKRRMREQGISDSLIERSLYYEDQAMERRYKQVLKLVTNPKTGKFWTCETLQLAGQLSDAEIESIRAEHKGKLPHIILLIQYGEYLTTETTHPSSILHVILHLRGFVLENLKVSSTQCPICE
jgi:hypothetical protein